MSVQEEVQTTALAYQILAAVNPNQDEFIARDKRATESRFSKTFFLQSVGKDIYEAI